jgi:hypothetical protein
VGHPILKVIRLPIFFLGALATAIEGVMARICFPVGSARMPPND